MNLKQQRADLVYLRFFLFLIVYLIETKPLKDR